MAKVATITLFESTPIRPATRGFSATARIARPILVRSTSSTRATMALAASTSSSTWVCEIMAPPIMIGSLDSSCGNGSGLRPQNGIAMTNVCSRIETPMAVIRGARRGALRRRR